MTRLQLYMATAVHGYSYSCIRSQLYTAKVVLYMAKPAASREHALEH